MKPADLPAVQGGVVCFLLRLFSRLRAALNTVTASRDATTDWMEVLGNVIAGLQRLNQDTERDFLKIGGKLGELIAAADAISGELAGLAELTSGEHGMRASEALAGSLQRTKQMRARAEEDGTLLCAMSEDASRLKRTLSGFDGTVTMFRTLGVLTRIETARLGAAGADFGNLAEDVKSLAGNVQARIENALETAALLVPPIERAMRDMSALEKERVTGLPSLLAELLASLSSLRDMQARVRDSSFRLASGHEAISSAFKRLIVSLQFHDITRQQVEHVMEALGRLRAEPPGNPTSDRSLNIGAVLMLQSRQLDDAAAKFAASAASIAQDIDEIARRVGELADETRTLSGFSENEHNSFFLQMEQACAATLNSLGRLDDADLATRSMGGELSATARRMHQPVAAIESIEIQVQRMALNASIRAAHIGPPGDALSVLAGSLQTLATECRERSQSLMETLQSVSRSATGMSTHGGTGESAGCRGAMRSAVAELHASSERSFIQIARIIARGARLREDLIATRDGFSVGHLFADAIAHAQDMLAQTGAKYQSGLPDRREEERNRSLAEFARDYTMQAERDVHESFTGMDEPLSTQVESPPDGQEEEMGANVEFF